MATPCFTLEVCLKKRINMGMQISLVYVSMNIRIALRTLKVDTAAKAPTQPKLVSFSKEVKRP
ncbi:hypothetical protein L484_015052 [Morus notabilis]|uniref:Uncharacterized protein n=1 Tax=Morus notabilis TaxID=981085 RepID=W9SF80_9ROSA|nr:hypothetical protein L484_015052 [Morus notabilis]